MFKLLKQLQPYISAGNLTVVQPARNFQGHNNPNEELNSLLTNIKV